MRRLESSRIFFILQEIKKNPAVNRAEIDTQLQRAEAKGRASVLAIMAALQSHPKIKSLSETEPYSSQDTGGLDIKVLFHPDSALFHTLGSVWIQAKSSHSGAQAFIARRGQAYLLKHKIVVLVGTYRAEEIVANFEEQLKEIIHHHRFSQDSF